MLSDIRNHYGLIREISSISQIAYFETTQLQQVVTEYTTIFRMPSPGKSRRLFML